MGENPMKTILSSVICCALCQLPLFAQAAATGGSADQSFVTLAAQTDMMEAHLGQLAQSQGSSQAVKDLGQMLTTDHTSDYTQLGTVATKAGLTVPKGIDAMHNKMIAPFEKLKGKAFDHRYAQMMVKGHQEAIAAYKKEASDGQNADIKAYAQQALPTLEKHLKSAQDAAKGKASS
jgi:putative membrane protein